jgi:multidrug efflux pump subunit AcrA (membrane-fusion protein)
VAAAQRQLDQAQLQADQDNVQAAGAVTDAKAALATVAADPAATVDAVASAKAKVVAAEAAVTTTAAAGAAAVATAQDQLTIAIAARDEALAPADTTEAETAVTAATDALNVAQSAYDALDRASGVMIPAGELVVVGKLPARVDTVAAAVGAKAEGTLVALSSAAVVVESTLTAAMKGLVAVGARVKIDDELSGVNYTGRITAIAGQQVTPKDGQSGRVGFPARIETDTPIDPKLLGTNVRVTITAASTGTAQLVVPLAAVFAQADGTSRVSRVVEGREELVTVSTGLAAGGFVTITASTPALKAGDQVVVGT